MSSPHLILGIDFSRKSADWDLLRDDGQEVLPHQPCPNTPAGFAQTKARLLSVLQDEPGAILQVGGEATSWYWLHFFWSIARDPDLAAYHPQLYLLNPLWVKWYKKSLPKDDKTDAKDPFYIADRVRTRPPTAPWQPQPEWLPLRLHTRLRFHLAQSLSREKNLFQLYLSLRYSGYSLAHPFADAFGLASRTLLDHPQVLHAWQGLAPDEQCQQLSALSHHTLPDPARNAEKLRQALADSFPVEEPLGEALQEVLHALLAHILFLEQQLQEVDAWIQTDLRAHHPDLLPLLSIPGFGWVYVAGIGAEIGGLERFFQGTKRDPRTGQPRPKNQRDVEDALAKYAGLWWPRNQSGDFEAEDTPLAKTGNRYLRYYLIEGAESLRLHLPEYARYYDRKVKEVKKHAHQRALVLTARKSLGLIVGLLHRNEPYRSEEERKP